MIDDKSPAETAAESSVENAEAATAEQLERERAQARQLGEETEEDTGKLEEKAETIQEPAEREKVTQEIGNIKDETAEANDAFQEGQTTANAPETPNDKKKEDPICFEWKKTIAELYKDEPETQDAENEKRTVKEMKEAYDKKSDQEKSAENDSFRKEYIDNLGFEEYHDEKDEKTKLAEYAEEQAKILERLERETSSPELQAKRAKYLEIKQEVKDIYHMNDQTKIDAVNDYRRTLGGCYRDAANMMKYQYLSLGLEDRERLQKSHMDMVLTIDKLEKTAVSLMKGLDDMDPEDKSLWERLVEGWEKFDKKCGELAKKSEKYTKRFDPFFFSLGAMLFYILDEKRMDEFMEKITKKKVWKPVRAKALK